MSSIFLIKLLHSGSCRRPYSPVQEEVPKSDMKANKESHVIPPSLRFSYEVT